MIAAPAPAESPDLAAKVESHVDTVLTVMTVRLNRAPSLSELASWGELYQLVGAALLARVEQAKQSPAPVVDAHVEPEDDDEPAPVDDPSLESPVEPHPAVKVRRVKHRGPAPMFMRSHHAGAPPTHPEPIPPGLVSPSVPKLTADEVLSNRPAKPPRRRVVEVSIEESRTDSGGGSQ